MINYVTGANGFVGQALVKQIDAVTIPHQEIDTIKLQPFDNFYFLSAYGNMSDHTNDDLIIKANLLDLITILKQVVNYPFKSLVYISTSSVTLPVQTTYSRTKKAGEEICLTYIEKYNLPITIVRPYSICGKFEQEKHLIPVLIKAALNNTEVNLCEGYHDFIDVDDFVSGVLNLSVNQAQGVYNLGMGVQTSNEEILKLVEQVTQKSIKVNRVANLRAYDSKTWVCQDFKARNWGWIPNKPLIQSIKETYEQITRDTKN